MKKFLIGSGLTIYSVLLSGCGDKSANLSAVYAVTALLASLLLVGYCCLVKKKDAWFLLLFASAMVVNIGYFSLSVSKNLEEALLANRLAYLGSAFQNHLQVLFLGIISADQIAHRHTDGDGAVSVAELAIV